MALIHEKIIAVMRDSEAISKDRKNQSQGYQFRGIDDVYASLHNILAKHGVFTMPEVIGERMEERTSKNGGALIYRILTIKYHFYAEDGSSVDSVVIGEGQDSGDKASNKAMSVAHKYALLQAFAIPTEDAKDPENDSHELASKPVEPKSDGSDIVKNQCVAIADEIKLSEDKKKTLWASSGKNWSNFLVLLKAEQKLYHEQIDAAWNDITKKIIEVETVAGSV